MTRTEYDIPGLIIDRDSISRIEKSLIWNFLLASYKGGMGMAYRTGLTADQVKEIKPSGFYPGLFKFSRETSLDYITRVAMTPYRRHAGKIADAFSEYVTKNEPTRENAADISDFLKNVDLKNTGLRDFVKTILVLQAVMGEINILVDMPFVEPGMEPVSALEELQAGIKPYCVSILPTEIADRSINRYGKYDWVVIENKEIRNLITEKSEKIVKIRTYWDSYGWIKYENINGKWVRIAGYTHPCGECPIIRITAKDIDNMPITPEAWFFDLADLNRAIYNLESQDMMNLMFQTFGTQILPGEGMTAEQVIIASISEAITESPEEKGITRYEQPSGASHEAFTDKIDDLTAAIYNVAGLMHRTKSRVPETAQAKEWDFQEMEHFLAGWAHVADKIENEIFRVRGLWLGQKTVPKSTYDKNFEVSELQEIIGAILNMKTVGWASETGRKESIKRGYRKLLPGLNPEKQAIIDKEVDESTEPDPFAGIDISGDNDNNLNQDENQNE